MRYFLSVLFIASIVSTNVIAQDDDFFLRSDDTAEEEIKESSEFPETTSGYIDDILNKTLLEQGRVLDYEPLREIDVLWEKRIWRMIDTREKMNQPFRNYDRPFFTILQDLAESGDIKVFADEKFKEPLGMDNLISMTNRIDTTTTYDPETYEEKIVITNSPLDPSQIARYRIKEVWYFDKESSVMKVRILGIAPILDTYEETTGEFKYSRPLFWVYYPKVRYQLARERVANDFNDIAPMSWYDLFEQRFFSSYITKSSNTMGLRIQDMYEDSDYDQLLEAEAIKQELFNWEHDLWTY
ncbi:MAG: gliding motility associated protein GldN [Saprospiraceae bacterium]|jgi:gliding motility associated protien GldN